MTQFPHVRAALISAGLPPVMKPVKMTDLLLTTDAAPYQRAVPDGMRRCPYCRSIKTIPEFAKRGPKSRGLRQSWCRSCMNAYRRKEQRVA